MQYMNHDLNHLPLKMVGVLIQAWCTLRYVRNIYVTFSERNVMHYIQGCNRGYLEVGMCTNWKVQLRADKVHVDKVYACNWQLLMPFAMPFPNCNHRYLWLWLSAYLCFVVHVILKTFWMNFLPFIIQFVVI